MTAAVAATTRKRDNHDAAAVVAHLLRPEADCLTPPRAKPRAGEPPVVYALRRAWVDSCLPQRSKLFHTTTSFWRQTTTSLEGHLDGVSRSAAHRQLPSQPCSKPLPRAPVLLSHAVAHACARSVHQSARSPARRSAHVARRSDTMSGADALRAAQGLMLREDWRALGFSTLAGLATAIGGILAVRLSRVSVAARTACWRFAQQALTAVSRRRLSSARRAGCWRFCWAPR